MSPLRLRRLNIVRTLAACATIFGLLQSVSAPASTSECANPLVEDLRAGDVGRSFARAKIILIGEYHYLPWWHARANSPLYDLVACAHPNLKVGIEAVTYGAATEALTKVLNGTAAPDRLFSRFDFPKFPSNLELLDWLKRRRIPAFGIDLDMWEGAYAEQSGAWQSAYDTVLKQEPTAIPPEFRRSAPLQQTDVIWAVPWRDDQMTKQILAAHADGSTIMVIAGLNHLPSIAARLVQAGVPKTDILMIFQDQGFPWADNVRKAYADTPDLENFKLVPSLFVPVRFRGIPALRLSYRQRAGIPSETAVIYDFSIAYLRLIDQGTIPTLTQFRRAVDTNCTGAEDRTSLCDILRDHLEH